MYAFGIAVTLTGIVIGGAAYFWRALSGLFTGVSRELSEEALEAEKTGLRRAA